MSSKTFLSTLLLTCTLSVTAFGDNNKQNSESAAPKESLVSSAIRFGMLSQAYLDSPYGMIAEGYRYQLRQLFLTYQQSLLQQPGNTMEKIREALLTDWMMRLGREKIGPTTLVQIKQHLESSLAEWSRKSLSGLYYEAISAENVVDRIENNITQCLKMSDKASSHPEKHRVCHDTRQVTRQVSSDVSGSEEVKDAMQKLLLPYATSLINIDTQPYYSAYRESRTQFHDILAAMMDKGYSTRQLAEVLELAGVDHPTVFDSIYELSLLQAHSIKPLQ